jgi:hypothetical protein
VLKVDSSDGRICRCDDDLYIRDYWNSQRWRVVLIPFFLSAEEAPRHRPDRPRFDCQNCERAVSGLAWLIVALFIHVQVSNRLAHQDCGLSGDPYVTLPNGYEVGSHNTYDGYIRAPRAQTDVPVAGPGYVRSIISLHLADDKFTGTQFDFKTSSVRRFTFDTHTQEFSSEPEGPLSWEAANDKAQLGEESYWKIYATYRHHWPNYVLLILIVGGEGAIGL